MVKSYRQRSSLFLAATIGSFLVFTWSAQVQGQTGGWEREWQKTIQAAKKEGKLVFHSGNSTEFYFHEFQKKFPEIKITRMLTRGGSAGEQRLRAERRAGVYLADIVHMGAGSSTRLADSGALDPLEPLMILPEVLDKSNWFEGKHHYADKGGKYVFNYAASPGVDIVYNSKLVNQEKTKSYWDLLDAKWKGKIVTVDPRRRGSGLFRFFYYHPELGPDYVRRLFGKMELKASRDIRQIVDWLALGKFAIALRVSPQGVGLDKAKAQGLPVDWFGPTHFKEGVNISGGSAYIGVVNRAPHPNAAKLFMNWFLSREGQITVQNIAASQVQGKDSLRIDIPKEMIPPEYRRHKRGKYIDLDKPEFRDEAPVFKLINEVWKTS